MNFEIEKNENFKDDEKDGKKIFDYKILLTLMHQVE